MIERLRKRIGMGERQGGFTLIELLVVIVIIGVLLAIAVPSYLGFKKRAENSTAQSNLRSAIPSVEAWYADNGSYTGMTTVLLKSTYDSGLAPSVTIIGTPGVSYCLKSVHGGSDSYYKNGPGGTIGTVACT